MQTCDVAIVGGGVIGCSVARALSLRFPDKKIVVVEKEASVAKHTSGRNSGVIHSGINLKPGTLKARLCVEGNRRLRQYCRRRGIPMREVGTVVLARTPDELEAIEELKERGRANGVPDVRIIDREELSKIEPYASGLSALHAPTGSIVDPQALVESIARDAKERGISLLFGRKVDGLNEHENGVEALIGGRRLKAGLLINCAGLYADKIARMAGVGEGFTIVPFRGDYFRLIPQKSHLVRSMIYPPPDFDVPFLGIHFTKTVLGDVILGPNAALAFGRESYSYSDIDPSEAAETLTDDGFLRLVSNREFLASAVREMRTSLFRHMFLREAQSLVPAVGMKDLAKDRAGNRAQLVDKRGNLVDDFVIRYTEHTVHILNTVSPGLTSSLAFADLILAELSKKGFFPSQTQT